MIKRFNKIKGNGIEEIKGQSRFAYRHSDSFTDFYDLIEWNKHGGYAGSVLMFYDYSNAMVFTPFASKRNVVYSSPHYWDGFYYFLQADYDDQKIVLYRYFPEDVLEIITDFCIKDIDLYNLELIGEGVHMISNNHGTFSCYYPEKISFSIDSRETILLMDHGKIYAEKWIEEGWDEKNHCATENYKYYHKVIIRDDQGHILSEEVGALNHSIDGTWWIT